MDAQLINGLLGVLDDAEFMATMISGVSVVFVSLWIRTRAAMELAYRRVKGNKRMALGRWVRIPTTVGHVDGKIRFIDRSELVIEIPGEGTMTIPILDADSSRWLFLDKETPLKADGGEDE